MSGNLPECDRLATELRTWRDRAGLSLTALAAKSPYSKSSWQRYLSGAVLPPWSAVQDLGTLTGAPEARLLALWQLADTAWSRRDAVRTMTETDSAADRGAVVSSESGSAPVEAATDMSTPEAGIGTGTDADAGSTGRRPRRWVPTLAAWLAAAVAAGVVGVAVVSHERSKGSGSIYSCSGTNCNGRDPQASGCGVTPQTLLDESVPDGADVQIRYSPGCHAVWARIWNSQVGDSVTLSVPHGPKESSPAADAMSRVQFVYTPLDGLPGRGSAITACVSSSQPHGAQCFTASSP